MKIYKILSLLCIIIIIKFISGCDHVGTIDDVKNNGIGSRGLHFSIYIAHYNQCQKLGRCGSTRISNDPNKVNPVCEYWPKVSKEIFNAEFGKKGVMWHDDKHYSYKDVIGFLDYHFKKIGNGYTYKLRDYNNMMQVEFYGDMFVTDKEECKKLHGY